MDGELPVVPDLGATLAVSATVIFAHDTEAALMAAVALVNSAVGPDTMTSLAELDAFLHRHAYTNTSAHDADRPRGGAGAAPCPCARC